MYHRLFGTARFQEVGALANHPNGNGGSAPPSPLSPHCAGQQSAQLAQLAREGWWRLAGFAGPLIDVVGTHFCKSAQADSARQRITGPLENAVKFSCVRHPTIKAD